MRPEEKKDEMKKEALRKGFDDVRRGVTYKEGIASLSRDFLIRSYTQGYTDGLKLLKEKK